MNNITVDRGKIIILASAIVNKKALRHLKIVEKVHKPIGMQKIYKAYYVDGANIVIPRAQLEAAFAAVGSLVPPIYVEQPEPECIPEERLTPSTPLFDYQIAAVEFVFEQDKPIVYLQMDTGMGKTRVGCEVIARLKLAAIVVVPTVHIAHQWVEEFKATYPDLVVKIYTNSAPTALADVFICVINTFRNKDSVFADQFGTIIYDEAHEYHSPCNRAALWLAGSQFVLGLSATPAAHIGGLDQYVCLHLGSPVRAPVTNSTINFKCVVTVIRYPAPNETVITPAGTMSAILTIANIIKDPERLAIIVSEATRLVFEGHNLYIFAEHRDFLPQIYEALSSHTVIAPEIGMLRGGASVAAIADAKHAVIVLVTYGYGRRGISMPNMTAIILATPRRNNMEQIIGRILRKGSDETIVRQIVDIVDVATGLHSQYYSRQKIYRARKYLIQNSVNC